MLRLLFQRFRKQTERKTDGKIKNIVVVDVGTLRHDLASESLIYLHGTDDQSTYTDGGDLSLYTYYLDLCEANKHEINREEKKTLRRSKADDF